MDVFASEQAKIKKMLVPVFLPLLLLLLEMVVPVMSALFHSVQIVSYSEARKTQNGPVMCALDPANETTSSSSLEDCSLKCAHNGTCTGFNIKNSLTCEVYNYKPKITALISGCIFYQVGIISEFLM